MTSFTAPLDVRQINEDTWRTLRAFDFYSGEDTYSIPKGFDTDFGSIPRIFWTLVGHPAGSYAQATVLHDYLYKSGIVSRKKADKLFLEGMKVLKCSRFQRWILYVGVRIGGWKAWNKHKKGDNAKRD